MPLPFLSLVFTSYNAERYVREALLSVLVQDYEGPKELIVVDDASTDTSPEVIETTLREHGGAWSHRFVRLETNGGVAMAMDKALSLAKGDWAVFIDCDDVQMPDRCSRTAELIARHPEATLINMSAELIDEDGRPYGKKSYAFAAYEKAAPELVCSSPRERRANYLTYDDAHIDAYGCTMAIRLDKCRQWGLLGEGMEERRFLQDSPWALRMMLCGTAIGSLHRACCYRSHRNNLLNRTWEGGVEGARRRELFQARQQSFWAATHRRMLADVLRAMQEPGLSDWDEEGLRALLQHERRELGVAQIRGDWWGIPWLHRLGRAFRSIGRLPLRMAFWPWLRLLPLTLVCRLKALRNK